MPRIIRLLVCSVQFTLCSTFRTVQFLANSPTSINTRINLSILRRIEANIFHLINEERNAKRNKSSKIFYRAVSPRSVGLFFLFQHCIVRAKGVAKWFFTNFLNMPFLIINCVLLSKLPHLGLFCDELSTDTETVIERRVMRVQDVDVVICRWNVQRKLNWLCAIMNFLWYILPDPLVCAFAWRLSE